MKQIICESCGSKDLVKEGKILVCQHCDTKYYIGKKKKNSNYEATSDNAAPILKVENSELPANSDLEKSFEIKPEKNSANWTILFVFSLFLGVFGIDRFYVGKKNSGIIKLLTLGGLGIWWIIDLFLVSFGKFTDASGKKVDATRQQKILTVFIVFLIILFSNISEKKKQAQEVQKPVQKEYEMDAE
jgi:TM2 domain-containing membrane protein YozV